MPSCPLTSASGEPLADHEGCGLSQGDPLQAGVRETLCFAMTRTAQTNLVIVGRSPAMHPLHLIKSLPASLPYLSSARRRCHHGAFSAYLRERMRGVNSSLPLR